MINLNRKQKLFADNYLQSLNAYESAINAGYSKNYAKAQSYKMLDNVGIKNYIEDRIQQLEDDQIAKINEILQYLTSVMRGEAEEEVVVIESTGDYQSKARKITKQVCAKDRIKAAELLGRRYKLFTDRIELEGSTVVQIIDDIGSEE